MFQNILVPIDLTDRHDRSLEFARGLAGRPGARVTLLHVVEIPLGMTTGDDPRFFGGLERKSRDHLKPLVDRLRDAKVDARGVVTFGERGSEVIRYARDEKVDLIVLSSHPIDPSAPGASWLSLSYLIGIGAPCPVLLVK